MEIDIDVSVDGDLERKIVKAIEEQFVEYIESEVQKGHLECDCGSDKFDIETWTTGSGDIQGEAVCRDCNERVNLDIDTSEFDKFK